MGLKALLFTNKSCTNTSWVDYVTNENILDNDKFVAEVWTRK